MEYEEYKALVVRHGTIHNIHYKRVVKNCRKAFDGRIVKETIGNFRIGCWYENLSINKDNETGSLPYGFFELSNEIIYSPSTNTHQLRLTSTNNGKIKPVVKYYLDGVEISLEKLNEMGAFSPSAYAKELEDKLIRNVPLGHIISIN